MEFVAQVLSFYFQPEAIHQVNTRYEEKVPTSQNLEEKIHPFELSVEYLMVFLTALHPLMWKELFIKRKDPKRLLL